MKRKESKKRNERIENLERKRKELEKKIESVIMGIHQ